MLQWTIVFIFIIFNLEFPVKSASVEEILRAEDGSGHRVVIEQDGVYLEFPDTYIRELDQYSKIVKKGEKKKIFDLSSFLPPYRVKHSENEFTIERLSDDRSEWQVRGTYEGIYSSTQYFLGAFSVKHKLSESTKMFASFAPSPEDKTKRYRVQCLDNQEFEVIFFDPDTSSERSIFKATGVVEGLETDYRSGVHLKWRDEHKGDQALILESVSPYPRLMNNVQYSAWHADIKVITHREPGYPAKHELWLDGEGQKDEYGTGIAGFDHLAQVELFYLQNILDETLSEDNKFKLLGMNIPVARYTIGDVSQKPTLLYIKGGPVVTKFGEFDPTYHLLAQHFNVYVVEYRGSSSKMGGSGSYEYLNGDIGGGCVRDVVSALRAIKTQASNIILAGHSFGGFILAKMMQDYPDDVAQVKGCMLLAPLPDILNMGRFHGKINNYMRYLEPTLAYGVSFEEVAEKLNQANAVSASQHMHRLPRDLKTLIIVPTHDGNVPMEDSIKFYIDWVHQLDSSIPATESKVLQQLGLYDVKDSKEWLFQSSSTPRVVLDEFSRWRENLRDQLSALPVQIDFVDDATHAFQNSPDVLSEYIRKIVEFANGL